MLNSENVCINLFFNEESEYKPLLNMCILNKFYFAGRSARLMTFVLMVLVYPGHDREALLAKFMRRGPISSFAVVGKKILKMVEF